MAVNAYQLALVRSYRNVGDSLFELLWNELAEVADADEARSILATMLRDVEAVDAAVGAL